MNYSLNCNAFLLLAMVTLLCAWKNVNSDTVITLETMQNNDETHCQKRSRLSGTLMSPEVVEQQVEFVTHLSHSRECCLWAGGWAGGHWDAGSAAGLGVRFPPGHLGWCGPRCFEIWAGRVPGPGWESGQPALQLQASPFPLTSQEKKHTHARTHTKQWGSTAPEIHYAEVMTYDLMDFFAYFLFDILVWTFVHLTFFLTLTCQSLSLVLWCLFCW